MISLNMRNSGQHYRENKKKKKKTEYPKAQ